MVFFLAFIFFFKLSFPATDKEILQLIEEVKSSPPDKRYIYMNKLKMKLLELEEREREKMIKRLYKEFKEKHEEHKELEHKELKHKELEYEKPHEGKMEMEVMEERGAERFEKEIPEKYERFEQERRYRMEEYKEMEEREAERFEKEIPEKYESFEQERRYEMEEYKEMEKEKNRESKYREEREIE